MLTQPGRDSRRVRAKIEQLELEVIRECFQGVVSNLSLHDGSNVVRPQMWKSSDPHTVYLSKDLLVVQALHAFW